MKSHHQGKNQHHSSQHNDHTSHHHDTSHQSNNPQHKGKITPSDKKPHHAKKTSHQNKRPESESVKRFKSMFENLMHELKERVDSFAVGGNFNGNWRDQLAAAGISAAALGGAGAVTALLSASAPLTAGATVAVGAIALTATTVTVILRAQQKMKQYKRMSRLLQRDDFDDKLASITQSLGETHQYQLENCSPADADRLAKACFRALKHELMVNKNIKFNDLLSRSTVEALIVKGSAKVRKKSVDINGLDDGKANVHSALKRAALYCKENNQFYRCEASKPAKYGVLFFSTKQEMKDYKLQIEKVKEDDSKWHFEKMSAAQVKMLMRNDLFPSADKDYQSRDDETETSTSTHTLSS